MQFFDLVDHVGAPLFADACACMWQTAAQTGHGEGLYPPGSEAAQGVPHDVSSLIWDGDLAEADQVLLLFQLYRSMPCYAHLMYAAQPLKRWAAPTRTFFWREYRRLLSDPDDRLADPVAYSLWCDFFEDDETVEEAWAAVAGQGERTARGIERLLDVAGPVPWSLKAPYYEHLLGEPRWHPAILRSLEHSLQDYFGQVDAKAALSVVRRLAVFGQVAERRSLEAKLLALQ